MCSSNNGFRQREPALQRPIFSTRSSFWPFLACCSLSDPGGQMNGGKNASAQPARAVGGGEQGSGNGSAYNVHLANSAGQSALCSFELQNHSARNLIFPDEVLDLAATHCAQHFFAVQHACHIGEKNQAIGLDKFSSRGCHMIGVDVVEFAIGAKPEARSDGNDAGAPKRTQKLNIYLR